MTLNEGEQREKKSESQWEREAENDTTKVTTWTNSFSSDLGTFALEGFFFFFALLILLGFSLSIETIIRVYCTGRVRKGGIHSLSTVQSCLPASLQESSLIAAPALWLAVHEVMSNCCQP